MSASQRSDVYARVTCTIVDAMEAGPGAWRMPWHHSGADVTRPANVATGKPYRGVNTVSLWAAAYAGGYASGIWGTATGSGQAAIPVPTVAQFPSCTAVFSKLPAGATISTSVQVWSGLGWAAAPSNLAEVRALAFFLP